MVATVLALGAAIAVYAREVALDTANFTEISGELLENDEIRPVLASYLVNQLYANVDVAGALTEVLPDQFDRLGATAAAGLRQLTLRTANQLLADPTVQQLWRDANREAHEQFVAAVEGESTALLTANGEVVLDLRPILSELVQRAGLPGVAIANLPGGAAQIVVLDQEQLDNASEAADALRQAAFWLVIAAVVLWVAAVWLARGRRRETVRAIAVGLILAGLVLVVLRRFIGTSIVDALIDANSVEPAGEAAWLIATGVLKQVSWLFIVLGLLAVVWAWLCGQMRWAVAARRWVAPFMAEHRLVVYGIAAAVILLLLAWGPAGDVRGVVGLAIAFVLVALGVETFRRQCARELTESEPPA